MSTVRHWKLIPALDASGNAMRTPIVLGLGYAKAFGGKYDRARFVAASDRFDSMRGRDHHEELPMYQTLQSFPVTAAIRAGKTEAVTGADSDRARDQLIACCGQNPMQSSRASRHNLL